MFLSGDNPEFVRIFSEIANKLSINNNFNKEFEVIFKVYFKEKSKDIKKKSLDLYQDKNLFNIISSISTKEYHNLKGTK